MDLQAVTRATAATLIVFVSLSGAHPDDETSKPDGASVVFHPPVRLKAGSEFVRTDAPGYATPAWYDATGDGSPDLVVGQFDGGKIQIFPSRPDGSFAPGKWMQAAGEVAKVPGVW